MFSTTGSNRLHALSFKSQTVQLKSGGRGAGGGKGVRQGFVNLSYLVETRLASYVMLFFFFFFSHNNNLI